MLNCDAITVTPLDVHWQREVRAREDSGEGLAFWEAQTCDECGTVLVFPGDDSKHRKGGNEDADWCEVKRLDEASQGPMMNYAYPLPNSHDRDPAEMARVIADLPLCVVQLADNLRGDYALALTGGGMNLSWEICAAYVACGYLPPVHFCDLPRMADRGQSASDRRIIARCRESARVAAGWSQQTARSLRQNFPAPKKAQRGAA
jgi:hypothetical protein